MDLWKLGFEIATLVAVALSVVFGGIALVLGNRINTEQRERARQFDSDLTQARKELKAQEERTADADARVAELEQGVATAKTEMAKQQTRAANAELALLQLRERLAHRRISPNEQVKLAAKLRPYAGSIVAVTRLGESEAAQFADDLIAVFHAAGWQVRQSNVGIVVPSRYGLACSVDESSPAGKTLAKILGDLPTANVTSVKLNGAVAVVLVGLKPPA